MMKHGELTEAFNQIQKLTQENIEEINVEN